MALKIGQLLIQGGLLTQQQLDQALKAQQTFGGKIGTNLVELSLISDEDLAEFLAKQSRIQCAKASDFEAIPRSVLDLIPKEAAEGHKAIPLRLDKKLVVAFSDPNDISAIDELSFKSGRTIQPLIAPEIWIIAALERYYHVARKQRYIPMEEEPTGPEISVPGVNVGDLMAGGEAKISLQTYADRLLRAHTKEDIFTALVDFLSPNFPRSAIFLVQKESIQGVMVRGFPIRTKEFRDLGLDRSADTLLRQVVEEGEPYFGPVPVRPEDKLWVPRLQVPQGWPVDVRPIDFRGKKVAIYLGLPEIVDPEAAGKNDIVQLACLKAGLGLEFSALRRLISEIPR
ncbi:MAG: hypothetical protein V1798_12395 [Pseudomonadota bacterium]